MAVNLFLCQHDCVNGPSARWQQEIAELHALFEGYFLGTLDSLARVEAALADDFTIVGPDGSVSDRSATLDALRAGHAHTESLKIVISGEKLLAETADLLVASYVESHELALRSNHRLTTVVFRRVATAPCGVQWVRAHETWIDRPS